MKKKVRIYNYYFLLMCIPTLLFAQNKNISFTDVTTKAGIDFEYTFGDSTYENILESSGSGITVFDYDNDGYMDLYLLNGTYLEGISDPEGKNLIIQKINYIKIMEMVHFQKFQK